MSHNLEGANMGTECTTVYQLILLCMSMGSIPPLPLATKYEAGLKEQMMIGTLNFVQGKISRRLAQDICGKSCPVKRSSDFLEAQLAIKSIWIVASQIWRAGNEAKHVKTEAENTKYRRSY
jgi:hypothetical protein